MKILSIAKKLYGAVGYAVNSRLCKLGLKKLPQTNSVMVNPSTLNKDVSRALFEEPKLIKVSDEEMQKLSNNAPTLSAKDLLRDMVKETIVNKVKSNRIYNFLRYFRGIQKKEIHILKTGVPMTHSANELPTDVAGALFPFAPRPVYRYAQ